MDGRGGMKEDDLIHNAQSLLSKFKMDLQQQYPEGGEVRNVIGTIETKNAFPALDKLPEDEAVDRQFWVDRFIAHLFNAAFHPLTTPHNVTESASQSPIFDLVHLAPEEGDDPNSVFVDTGKIQFSLRKGNIDKLPFSAAEKRMDEICDGLFFGWRPIRKKAEDSAEIKTFYEKRFDTPIDAYKARVLIFDLASAYGFENQCADALREMPDSRRLAFDPIFLQKIAHTAGRKITPEAKGVV